MADLSITAANVKSLGGETERGRANAAITAGQTVYRAADGRWGLADSNSVTPEIRQLVGIALNNASTDQPVEVHTGGDINLGATLTVAAAYFLSETPGGIQPAADLASGETVTLIGLAKSTSVLSMRKLALGITIA